VVDGHHTQIKHASTAHYNDSRQHACTFDQRAMQAYGGVHMRMVRRTHEKRNKPAETPQAINGGTAAALQDDTRHNAATTHRALPGSQEGSLRNSIVGVEGDPGSHACTEAQDPLGPILLQWIHYHQLEHTQCAQIRPHPGRLLQGDEEDQLRRRPDESTIFEETAGAGCARSVWQTIHCVAAHECVVHTMVSCVGTSVQTRTAKQTSRFHRRTWTKTVVRLRVCVRTVRASKGATRMSSILVQTNRPRLHLSGSC
jgi:hypothetical protein